MIQNLSSLTGIAAYGELTAKSKSVKELIADLQGNSSEKRRNAARVLGNMGAAAYPAIPHLVKALAHKDLTTGEAANNALMRIGKPAVPELKKVLYDENETLRESAISCLGNMRANAVDALSQIRSIASQNEEQIGTRYAAVWAIGNIVSALKNYSETGAVVTELSILLKHWNKDIRYCAAEALGKIGEQAKDAIPHLKNTINRKGEEQSVKNCAQWALGKIDPESVDGSKSVEADNAHKTNWGKLRNTIDHAKEIEKKLER